MDAGLVRKLLLDMGWIRGIIGLEMGRGTVGRKVVIPTANLQNLKDF